MNKGIKQVFFWFLWGRATIFSLKNEFDIELVKTRIVDTLFSSSVIGPSRTKHGENTASNSVKNEKTLL